MIRLYAGLSRVQNDEDLYNLSPEGNNIILKLWTEQTECYNCYCNKKTIIIFVMRAKSVHNCMVLYWDTLTWAMRGTPVSQL